MKPLFKNRKIISLCMVLTCLLTLVNSSVFIASATTINESESNDTWSTGDQTVDDANNYGTLPDADDIDWWYVTFPKDGYANYWLNAPSGCNYYMRLYDGDVTLLEKAGTSGRQELIRFSVTAGETYRIRIATSSTHSTSTYTFRAKWYPKERVYPFVYNHENDIDTTFTGTTIMSDLWNMGYSGSSYLNNSASAVFTSLPKADVLIFRHHGSIGGGSVLCGTSENKSHLYAKNGSLNVCDSPSLANTELVIWGGCYAGATSYTYGNLVDETLAKGAKCVIGWQYQTYTPITTYWVETFLATCSKGKKISTAIDAACSRIDSLFANSDDQTIPFDLSSYYTGSSSDLNQVIG